jgi:drug/metabolite transporter (DMT)-like permease
MQSTQAGRNVRAEMQLLVVVVIWASNFPITKFAIATMDMFVFNSIRFVVASGILAALFFSRSTWVPLLRDDWSNLLKAGAVASILYQLAFIIGLSLTSAGNAAILLATAPLWTVILNARLHNERVERHVWLGLIGSLAGIAMIIVGSGKKVEFGSAGMAGDLISIAAAFFWAFNTNLQKPLLVRYSPTQLALVFTVIGAVGLTIIAVPSAATTDWGGIGWPHYLAAIVSGGLSIAAANVFWSYGVQRLGPGSTANFGNLIPVLAFAMAYVTLKEELNEVQVIGAVVTLAGVWIARK